MSAIRLLVLGVIRFTQPVHGYDVRRELLSWQIDDITNVKPGSVYSALKTLHRDGLIATTGPDRAGTRPERTAYTLTGEGEKEFQVLLRRTWWEADQATEPLVPGLSMFPQLSRSELVAAVESRIETLRGRVRQGDFMLATIAPGATGVDGGIPDHAREIILFQQLRTKAEIEWSVGFRRRLLDGAYVMADEPGGEWLRPAAKDLTSE